MAEKETVLTLTYDLLLYATPQVGKYPRSHKFTLGDRIQSGMLSLMALAFWGTGCTLATVP